MKGLVLAAGWPFAGLLALEAGRSGTSGTAPVRGFIAESDDQSGLCVLKSGEIIGPLAIDAMTRCYGVDGYPISCGDIQVGDTVEAILEEIEALWMTTRVCVLRLVPVSGQPLEDDRRAHAA